MNGDSFYITSVDCACVRVRTRIHVLVHECVCGCARVDGRAGQLDVGVVVGAGTAK